MSDETEKEETKAKATLDFGKMTSVAEARDALNKKYGLNTFLPASQVSLVRRCSSGCFIFDFLTGGGFPERRFTELNGMESSFKSTLALSGMAQFQKMYERQKAEGLYIDLEQTFEKKHARKLGVNLDRCTIFDPNDGEQAVDGVVDFIKLPIPLFVILDSLAAMRPRKEHIVDMTDNMKIMGLQARLVGHAMQSFNARIKRTKTDMDFPPIIFVVLNQLREKVGLVFGNPEYTPGGKAKDFYYSMTVRLRRETKVAKEKVTSNGVQHEFTTNQDVSIKVIKNKAGGPQRGEGDFTFNFKTYDYDNAPQALNYGMFYNIIQRKPLKKSFGYVYGNVKTPLKEDEFLQYLVDNPTDLEDLYLEIMDHIVPKKKKVTA